MDIQKRKIDFVQEFLDLENEGLISQLENLLHSKSNNSKVDFKRMSTHELDKRIDKSMLDSEKENLTKSDDLITELNQWK